MFMNYTSIIKFLFIVLSFISVQQWVIIPITTTFFNWIIYFLFSLALIAKANIFNLKYSNNKDYRYVKWFLIWILICFFRGILIADNYWDFKSLITNSFALLLGVAVYAFTEPKLISDVLKNWLKFAPFLFLFLMPFLETTAYGYFLVPLSFLALFFFGLTKVSKIFVTAGILIVMFIDLDARSNVIKFIIPIIFSFLIFIPKLLRLKSFKVVFLMFTFSIPFLFLGLAVTGTFSIFKMDEYISGNYTQKKTINGQIEEVNLKADTRTFLFEEVISSAIKNNYVVFGRTPARGNDSYAFGSHAAKELGTGRYERYNNEVSILNIFTWTGLLGVFLYFMVFLRAAYLALFNTNNTYMIVLGCYISFRWGFAWVEDFNRFDVMNMMLWIGISMCYSKSFRLMSNLEIEHWLRGITILPLEFNSSSIQNFK
jgi:hypothetical protein